MNENKVKVIEQEETTASKVKTWFKEHKTVIFGFCAYTLGCVVTGLLAQKRMESAKREYFFKGADAQIERATFGLDSTKDIIGCDVYDYAGYGEYHDCDDEEADKLLKFIQKEGYTENDIDAIRQVVFVQMNKKNRHDQAK